MLLLKCTFWHGHHGRHISLLVDGVAFVDVTGFAWGQGDNELMGGASTEGEARGDGDVIFKSSGWKGAFRDGDGSTKGRCMGWSPGCSIIWKSKMPFLAPVVMNSARNSKLNTIALLNTGCLVPGEGSTQRLIEDGVMVYDRAMLRSHGHYYQAMWLTLLDSRLATALQRRGMLICGLPSLCRRWFVCCLLCWVSKWPVHQWGACSVPIACRPVAAECCCYYLHPLTWGCLTPEVRPVISEVKL